jgi:hypothetical protein
MPQIRAVLRVQATNGTYGIYKTYVFGGSDERNRGSRSPRLDAFNGRIMQVG